MISLGFKRGHVQEPDHQKPHKSKRQVYLINNGIKLVCKHTRFKSEVHDNRLSIVAPNFPIYYSDRTTERFPSPTCLSKHVLIYNNSPQQAAGQQSLIINIFKLKDCAAELNHINVEGKVSKDQYEFLINHLLVVCFRRITRWLYVLGDT